MLWNWYTVNACFLSSSWHIRSKAHFAGSCIGVVLLVVALELVRRAQREFDNRVLKSRRSSTLSPAESASGSPSQAKQATVSLLRLVPASSYTPKLWEQVVRSLLYMVQFAVGYIIMLLAMYYNGTRHHRLTLTTRPVSQTLTDFVHV